MQRLVGLFAVLLVLSALFRLVEAGFAANASQPKLRGRRGLRTDLAYWFMTPFLTRSVSQVGLALILVAIYRRDVAGIQQMLAERQTLLTAQPAALQALEMLLVGDLIGYLVHRAFHRGRLWRFHAIHHSSKDLDWLSSVRVHPVNTSLARWIQAGVLLLLGFSPLAVAAYVPFLTLYAIFLHANVSFGFGPLGAVVASPKFHRWHHTSKADGLDRNYAGLFPFIDRLFGTYYMPAERLPTRFGVDGGDVPEGFLDQLAYPFRRGRARPAPARRGARSRRNGPCSQER